MLAIVSIFSYQEQISDILAAEVSDSDVVDVTAVVVDPNANTGGGSTGSQTNPSASVTLSGYSFPGAKLTLLRDGYVVTTLFANNDGTFVIVVNGVRFGNYQFAVYAEDRDGVQSAPYAVNVNVSNAQGYTFNGILIPPTINVNPSTIQPGQISVVFGYTAPNSTVSIEVPGQYSFGSTIADGSGFYRFEVRQDLPLGTYYFRSRAQLGSLISMYSKPVAVSYFAQGQITPPPPAQLAACVDYNRDRRVNLIDFSILLFWLNKPNPPANIDCNSDNIIDIKDFSVLMYFWTG